MFESHPLRQRARINPVFMRVFIHILLLQKSPVNKRVCWAFLFCLFAPNRLRAIERTARFLERTRRFSAFWRIQTVKISSFCHRLRLAHLLTEIHRFGKGHVQKGCRNPSLASKLSETCMAVRMKSEVPRCGKFGYGRCFGICGCG